MNIIDTKQSYCGFITIVGRPNVGKSTIMNHLIGQKISITSRKPQTTQHVIHGVNIQENCQYIFVDTPGFQTKYMTKINTLLNEAVINELQDIDVVLFIVEAGLFNSADEQVIQLLPRNKPVFLVINKIDKYKDKILMDTFIKSIQPLFKFENVLLVSAKQHDGIDNVLKQIKGFIPEGSFLYLEDQVTNRDKRFLTAEIIREKLFRYLGQELPYNATVIIDEYNDKDDIAKISAIILVDKQNQKGIVIGKNGLKLKHISTEARIDIEKLLIKKVFLQLWVKVKTGFADEEKFLQQFSK